jgi:hypothetical protein
MPLREDQLLPELRRRKRALAAKEQELRREPGLSAAYVEQKIRTWRAEAHEAAVKFTDESGVLAEIFERKPKMADHIPGKNEGAAERIADGERARRKAAPDPALARTSLADLLRLAGSSTDVVTIADIRREIRFRGEQDESIAALAPQLDRRLDEVAGALPETVKRSAEFERISVLEENVGYALRALETGGEDEGVKYDLYREARRKLDAGEIDKDGARAMLQEQNSAA